MVDVLLVYPPFCSPVSPVYSLASLFTTLKKTTLSVSLFDANVYYYNTVYPDEKKDFLKQTTSAYTKEQYEQTVSKHKRVFDEDQKKQIQNIFEEQNPLLFDEILQTILEKNPTYVAFSLLFSSQVFYTSRLITALKKHGIITIVGGPAVSGPLVACADFFAKDHASLCRYLEQSYDDVYSIPDYSSFDLSAYFTSKIVYPLKSSSTCYYRKCAFCTHHTNEVCVEYPIENIEQAIIENSMQFVFFIDDMIKKNRLLELAKICKRHNVVWMCQLKPTIDLDAQTLQSLYDSGLHIIIWGVESGSDVILKKMKKGTRTSVIKQVLFDAHQCSIQNVLYIMFGFPTETKEQFLETISFLKEQTKYIDLVSTSIFGLQFGSYVYAHPFEFSISSIQTEQRTFLDPTITYTIDEGLTPSQVKSLQYKYKKTLQSLQKVPKAMNIFREHHLLVTHFKK